MIRHRTSVPNQRMADVLALGHARAVSRYCSGDTATTEVDRGIIQRFDPNPKFSNQFLGHPSKVIVAISVVLGPGVQLVDVLDQRDP